ncbi:MAG: serine hydrolase [Cyclobacteriaceae bacterium]
MKRSKLQLFISLLVVLLLFSNCQQVGTLPANVVESIEKRIENELNPSVAIAIVDESGTRFYNFGKVRANGEDVDEHTIYEIGSISKVFTSILLSQKVIKGSVSLDDPINQFLPEDVVVPILGSNQITLGNLSDHTSGLPRMPQNLLPANPNNPYADYSVDQMYSFISTYNPIREVGAEYEYSNLAQGLLGHLLALNEGVSYEKLMIDNIASPLEMNETKIVLDQTMSENLAIGHSGGMEAENWDLPTLAGAGAIRSSTSDMITFISANMGLNESPLLPSMELSHTIRHSKAGTMRVGLAWHIKKGAKGDVIWHNGGTGGYRAFAGFVKETGKGVVVLTNSAESVDDIGMHLLDPETELKKVKPKVDVVQVPEEILERYVGTYELTPAFRIVITREGTRLFEQATGQGRLEIFAKNESEFFLKAVEAQVTFQVRDDDTVGSMTLFQNGQEMIGKRLEDGVASDTPSMPEEVEVAEEILEKYVGSYQLAPSFSIVITREGNRLFEQATGQGKLEIFAKSETEFFMKVVDAQATFQMNDDGTVESMMWFQNGQQIVGKKTR